MSTISTQLRNFKEPTKDQLTHIFFSIPSNFSPDGSPRPKSEKAELESQLESMDISAVLSLGAEGEEDSYVCSV